MPTATNNIGRRLGGTVKKLAGNKGKGWFSPHMVAAARAIAQRIPLVDLVLEIRDARIPLSSEFEQLRHVSSSSQRVIVLNKMDLADRSQVKEWMRYFEQRNCLSYGVNSHNKEDIRKLLNFIQARVREMRKDGGSNYTAKLMLIGIPNVGKSALANSLHLIGRTSAAEKGKLKHAVVSPLPGETKDISSLKIGSHPNIYVLDTPGILPCEITDFEAFAKLALTGAVHDCLVGEKKLAHYYLSILNLSDEYKKWAKLTINENDSSLVDQVLGCSGGSKVDATRVKQYPTDHTQDFIVRDVRRTLYKAVSSFDSKLEDENDMMRLIEAQIMGLREAFRIPLEPEKDAYNMACKKLLNLYRTGRLGRYTLDAFPVDAH